MSHLSPARLGIDMQCLFGMPPVDHVHLAADLDCGQVSIGFGQMPWNPCNFPAWSLRDDVAMQQELRAVMQARGVALTAVEGFVIRPNVDVRDRVAELDLAAKLGAAAVSSVSMERDLPRALDQLATLADLAAERGLRLCLEYAPPHPINTLASALSALRTIDKPNARLVIDSMHFFRAGGAVAELAALDPALIGHVQFADAPLVPVIADYMQEATLERLIPGEGELPLREFVAALPADVSIGLEIPMCERAAGGKELVANIRRAVEASRALLAQAALA